MRAVLVNLVHYPLHRDEHEHRGGHLAHTEQDRQQKVLDDLELVDCENRFEDFSGLEDLLRQKWLVVLDCYVLRKVRQVLLVQSRLTSYGDQRPDPAHKEPSEATRGL